MWLDPVINNAHAALLALPVESQPRQYLRERGVTDEEVLRYRIGYWGDTPAIAQCTEEFWLWVQRFGYNRLIFPMTDPFGVAIGLQGRHMDGKGYENFVLKPRELYVPCFGLHVAAPAMFASERVVLVEGVFDYFAMVKVAPDTLATLTAMLSNAQKRLISRYVEMVVCLFDTDAPGRRGAYKLAGLEVPAQYRRPDDVTKTRLVQPPFQVVFPHYTEHDPADLLKMGKLEELQKLSQHEPLLAGLR